ncbi:hypothetical protein MSG28_011705 [Choristoneura fumiferana]|uniref:Uncharacterized protein n=1 Tax=Choristoneura fumiferana TaxID=7141 RepID=A0ACC0KLB7_CHOFU|nr:hypothetical protein MSG28_011705 [Choristoneura fumiferana]
MSYSNKYVFAALPRTQRGTPLVLGGDPKGRNFLYTNGNSVIIRDIENPAIADVYTEHSCQVNVAKYSPSGFYIASGVGEISGQSKPINSVDFRPARPFRIVTASEDNTLGEHTRFAQAVRYSPDGSLFASAGFDGKIFLFDGLTSELKGEINAMKAGKDGSLLSCGIDDSLRRAVPKAEGRSRSPEISRSREPYISDMRTCKDGSLLTCGIDDSRRRTLQVINGSSKQSALPLDFEPTCVSIDPQSRQVVVGVRTLTEGVVLQHLGQVTDVCFSDDSQYLAASDANRKEETHPMDLLSVSLDVDSGSEDEEEIIEQLQEIPEDEVVEEEADVEVDQEFSWSADYASFTGVEEDFQEVPGPKIKGINPLAVFTQLWDQELMEHIRDETNRYAWQFIAAASENDGGVLDSSRVNDWVDTSVPELYRLVAVLILMSLCLRGRIEEYWSTGVMGMQQFRTLMSKEKKLAKIKPILDFLNTKFQAVYSPRKELSLDESLLLWKDAHPQSQITGLTWLDDETIVSVGQDANTRVWTVPKA